MWVIYWEDILKSTWACHSGGLPGKEPRKKSQWKQENFIKFMQTLRAMENNWTTAHHYADKDLIINNNCDSSSHCLFSCVGFSDWISLCISFVQHHDGKMFSLHVLIKSALLACTSLNLTHFLNIVALSNRSCSNISVHNQVDLLLNVQEKQQKCHISLKWRYYLNIWKILN